MAVSFTYKFTCKFTGLISLMKRTPRQALPCRVCPRCSLQLTHAFLAHICFNLVRSCLSSKAWCIGGDLPETLAFSVGIHGPSGLSSCTRSILFTAQSKSLIFTELLTIFYLPSNPIVIKKCSPDFSLASVSNQLGTH